MDKINRVLVLLCVILVTAAITFSLTYYFVEVRPASLHAAPAGDPQQGYDKLKEIRSIIDRYYIGEVDEDYMSDALAAGMVEGIQDEWSYYIPADSYGQYMETMTNSYVGVGITITQEDGAEGFLITDVTPDGPAYHAGLQIGDLIVGVDGQSALELGMEETKNHVRGEEGTDVTITILRDDAKTDYTITRQSISVVNVTHELLPDDVAYIKIRNFDQNCARDTIAAIESELAQGAKGIVFDVRFNPGGMKDEMVAVLDYLLPEGPLFRSVSYNGRESVDTSDAACLEIPMAVLVNKDSYSAAEFFAAALQEYDAATVVGTQTYGKGRFQTAIRLSDGSAVNLSIGKYTTPNGVSLVGTGITPDVVVEVSDDEYMDIYYGRMEHADDEQLKSAILAVK